MTDNYLEVKNLSKNFGPQGPNERLVLKDISFKMKKGEVAALLGPSGCGKSTLLNLIAGFIEPDAGEIILDGRPCLHPGPDRAVVFQESALFPWLSALENVILGAKTTALPKNEIVGRAKSLLKRVGLSGFEDYTPGKLSGGMKQRVSLARALAMSPKALLLDEPMASLDAITRERMWELLIELHQEMEMTIFLVTHDQREAMALADTIILMGADGGPGLSFHNIPEPRRVEFSPELLELGRAINKRLQNLA